MPEETPSPQRVLRSELLASLPPVWPNDPVPQIQSEIFRQDGRLIVIDDEPTGTQTVHDVPVLTDWSVEALAAELKTDGRCFHVLTNTRAMAESDAARVNREVAVNLRRANEGLGRKFVVISRGDSTLRGHFPAELEALGQGLFPNDSSPPPILLVPFFEAGGRFTINDVHYVADDQWLVPAGVSEYARDPVLGYKSSNLRDWVSEKTGGRVRPREVLTITIEDLRLKGPDEVAWKLMSLEAGHICIVNAARARDLEVLALATLRAEKQGLNLFYRAAAGFVPARLGLAPRPLWKPLVDDARAAQPAGGLILVGSHLPQTNGQLRQLEVSRKTTLIPLTVEKLLGPEDAGEVARVAATVNAELKAGRDVTVFTSRELATGEDKSKNLEIGHRVTAGLAQLLQSVDVKPRFVVAKGGITSGELATKGLGIKRTVVLGQILPGVPVWQLGPETKFPGVPYIIFPGNVGGATALTGLLEVFAIKKA